MARRSGGYIPYLKCRNSTSLSPLLFTPVSLLHLAVAAPTCIPAKQHLTFIAQACTFCAFLLSTYLYSELKQKTNTSLRNTSNIDIINKIYKNKNGQTKHFFTFSNKVIKNTKHMYQNLLQICYRSQWNYPRPSKTPLRDWKRGLLEIAKREAVKLLQVRRWKSLVLFEQAAEIKDIWKTTVLGGFRNIPLTGSQHVFCLI